MSKSEQKRIRYQKTGKLDDPIREAAEDAVAELYGAGFANSGPRNRQDETQAIEIIERAYRAKLEAAVPAPLIPSSEWESGYNEALAVCRKAFLGGE